MPIHVGVITNNKSCTGKFQVRAVGPHNGVQNPANEKWSYGTQGSDAALAGVGTHPVHHPGTRVFLHEFGPDGSYGILGSFPRAGSEQGGGGGGEYDSATSINDVNYKEADTPIDFKNPGPDGQDNEMDVPSGRYNKYAGGKGFDSSSFKYGAGSGGLAPYKK